MCSSPDVTGLPSSRWEVKGAEHKWGRWIPEKRKVLGDRDVSGDCRLRRVGRIGMASVLFACLGATGGVYIATSVRECPNVWCPCRRVGRLGHRLVCGSLYVAFVRAAFVFVSQPLAGICLHA